MSRIMVDVPVIAHKAFEITTGYIIKNGKFVEDNDDRALDDIKKMYPYQRK
nr:MAG TPA: hypothetical protein [Caudoviricetes sp.]